MLDWMVGGLPVTGKKKMSHLASGRRMWGNDRLFRLTLALRKIVGQIFLTAMLWLLQGKKVTGNSQDGLTKGKSCLTRLIAFCDRTGCLSRYQVNVVYLGFSGV